MWRIQTRKQLSLARIRERYMVAVGGRSDVGGGGSDHEGPSCSGI